MYSSFLFSSFVASFSWSQFFYLIFIICAWDFCSLSIWISSTTSLRHPQLLLSSWSDVLSPGQVLLHSSFLSASSIRFLHFNNKTIVLHPKSPSPTMHCWPSQVSSILVVMQSLYIPQNLSREFLAMNDHFYPSNRQIHSSIPHAHNNITWSHIAMVNKLWNVRAMQRKHGYADNRES
jgi:hypothetical protein